MSQLVSLVFPHQLFRENPALSEGTPVYLIEDTLFFGDAHASPGRFHKQKIALHRASMKAYKAKLEADGFEVSYIDYDRDRTIGDILGAICKDGGYSKIRCADAVDFLLEKRLCRFSEANGVDLVFEGTPMFVTPAEWADEHFGNRKKPYMAAFYEAQRKRMGLLVDEAGEPEGGRWSYDDENRKSMPKRGLDTPPDPTSTHNDEVEEAIQYVRENFSDYPGELETFAYAVTHSDAEKWLERFFEERFELFGPYEDALSEKERVLFHSILTPALNIGLLTPQQVVDRALAFASKNGTPLNSLEGFVRQIIGWREFMFLMYRRHGVEMRTRNHFGHKRDLPKSFWDGTTGIAPIDLVIKRVLETGYAHHIERLMVLGNFMLLCQFDPKQVNDWFMELFIDAYDWVMVPNVFGMSQFADGGIFTTKPYISGSNYLKKMSDYKTGDWCPVWDGLFWNFIDANLEFFKGQHRLGMMVATFNRMDEEKRATHLQNAGDFLESL